ncbi:MAG: dynamin family protein, partial [Methylobacter sp.]|nr:dynamin family protein [Methylobacter sp.]
MRNMEFKEQMHEYSQWRAKLVQAIEMYHQWRGRYGMNDPHSTDTILNILNGLQADRITLAFVAEFSRGKTELINSLFFAETGVRLLPSSPGRTTMSPTELFHDEKGGNYIRLLNIESRLEDISLVEFKKNPDRWTQIDLDCTSPTQMQEAFKELVATKQVDREVADKLGLWNEREAAEQGIINPEKVEIPCWRHALISFPHPLLKEGLSILDTPGLNALGTEPELTLNMLPSAQAIIFVLAADTGVTKSDLEMWRNHVCHNRGGSKQGLAVVMNKIDVMWDD